MNQRMVSAIFFVLMYIPFQNGISQGKADTSVQINSNPELFNTLINEQFSSLITGVAHSSIGNFISTDPTDAKVTLAGSMIFRNGSILTLKVNGAVSDGLLPIFTNSKLNTNIALDVQYDKLDFREKSLTYYPEVYCKYLSDIDSLEREFDLDTLKLSHRIEIKSMQLKIERMRNSIDSLLKKVGTAQAGPLKDSLQYELDKRQIQKHWSETDLEKMIGDTTEEKMKMTVSDLRETLAEKVSALRSSVKTIGFHFGWFSIGYKVQNNSFRLFNASIVSDSQIVKSNFVSHEARIQYSVYRWIERGTPFNASYFGCLGLAFTYNDNLDDLTSQDLTEVKNYGIHPNDRTSTTTYKVYTGDYIRDIVGTRLYGDIYWFLFNNNIGAIHFFPEWRISNKSKPILNMGTGLLVSFKSGKDESSIVNAELYYVFTDIAHVTDTTKGLFERNTIGLRFAFPINFML